MVKLPYTYTDSDTEELSSSRSSASEILKKKKRFSILKYTNANLKKKKCKIHSKSEPDESVYTTSSRTKVKTKLPGILKHREKEIKDSSDEEEESESISEPVKPYNQSRYLVGRVPRPAGTKPGRGGGVALIVKKNVSSIPPPQVCSTSSKRAKFDRNVSRKRSF